MSDKNVYLSERLKEAQAMRREVEALEAQSDDVGQAIRGPGVLARPAYSAEPVTLKHRKSREGRE